MSEPASTNDVDIGGLKLTTATEVVDAVGTVELKASSGENNNGIENGNNVEDNANVVGTDGDDGDDDTDSRGFFSFTRTSRTTVIEPTVGILRTDFDSLNYAMNGLRRGKCLIINHRHFDRQTNLNARNGTEVDGKSLENTFSKLDFEVEVLNDPTYMEVRTRLYNLSKEDHSEADCLLICILTHGDRGSLWARDRQYSVDEIYVHFTADKCLTLAGKPKLFFLQACQGSDFDRGTTVVRHRDVADSATYYKIPNWADFLIVYSTVPGHYSWRNPRLGSWFVQALCKVLEQYSSTFDLLSMLTIVGQHVAYNFESVADQAEFHGNKQVPCITSMLTRRVFFNPSV